MTITLHVPSIDTLIDAALTTHAAAADIAHAKRMTDASALLIAAHALQCAIDDLPPGALVLPALRDAALAGVVNAALDAREAAQQGDIFEYMAAAGRTYEGAQA